jgi:hypothetical protein
MSRLGAVLAVLGLLAVIPGGARGQAVGFAPQIGYAPDGAVLSVTPVASADRRYVRMTLSPQFYGFQGFDTVSVPAAVGGGGINAGFGGFNGAGFGAGGMGFGPNVGMFPGALTTPSYGPLMGTIRSRTGRGRW